MQFGGIDGSKIQQKIDSLFGNNGGFLCHFEPNNLAAVRPRKGIVRHCFDGERSAYVSGCCVFAVCAVKFAKTQKTKVKQVFVLLCNLRDLPVGRGCCVHIGKGFVGG